MDESADVDVEKSLIKLFIRVNTILYVIRRKASVKNRIKK